MSFLGRLKSPDERSPSAVEPARARERDVSSANSRRSNGLKDFLWLIPEEPQGRLLDLGAVAQSTVMFFADRGFRVSTEDLVRGWSDCQARAEAEPKGKESSEPSDPSALVSEFLKTNLQFPPETFHGILAWDALDFLPPELLEPLAARLHSLLAPGGVLLAIFHDSAEIEPVRYRVRDNESVDLVPARGPDKLARVFQNREILALFSEFRSSRTYVGRDHLREALFLK